MSKSESCLLFHGPRAQDRAGEAARAWGRVVGVFGHPQDGLDIEATRGAVEALSGVVAGDKLGVVIIGPLDILSKDGIEDVLLKTVEDYTATSVRPYLWAYDLGGVKPTIRSRCIDVWSPGVLPPSPQRKDAAELVRAMHNRSVIELLDALGESKVWKAKADNVLREVPEVLRENLDVAAVKVWLRARNVMRDGVPLHEAVARLVS